MPFLVNPKLEVIRKMADRYNVGQRTIYRWQLDGVNLDDPCAVALHLAGMKNPAPGAVVAVKQLLAAELKRLSKTN